MAVWSNDAILEALVSTLMERDGQLREEQAVYGLDALGETELHALLAEGLAARGFRVLREQAFPSTWNKRKAEPEVADWVRDDEMLPLPRDRQRCDLVLLPEGCTKLNDDVRKRKAARATRAEVRGTLFESHAEAELREVATQPTGCCEPEDAYWLEFKLVAQQSYVAGVPGPNRTYASELGRSLSADVAKLGADRRVRCAAAALILMTGDEETARHDLTVTTHRLLDRSLPIQSPMRAGFGILDRIGNTRCTVMLVPLAALANVAFEE